jgi:C4-dicarboxylate transporter, DcuC family
VKNRASPGLMLYTLCFAGIFAFALVAETGLLPPSALTLPVGALNALFVLVALYPVRGYVLVVSTLCLTAAAGLAFAYRVPFLSVLHAFNKSSGIIAFLAVVPAVALPIRHGGYIDAMEAYIAAGRGRGTGGSLRRLGDFLSLAAMQLLMAVALNIGSIPTMQRLLSSSRLPKPYLSLVYSAGYSSNMVLSPFDGLVNALILTAGTSYAGYIPRGLAMAGAIFAGACVILSLDKGIVRELNLPGYAAGSGFDTSVPGPNAPEAHIGGELPGPVTQGIVRPGRRILELAAHIVCMIILSAAAIRLLKPDNPSLMTALVLLLWSLVWIRMLGIPWSTLKACGNEYLHALESFRSFLPFLISAGLLGAMTAYTPFKDAVGALLASMGGLPRYFTLQAVILATALLSLVGVHMMITVAAIAASLSPATLGISNPGFALLLLSSWFIAMNLSPFAPFSAIIGESIGESPARVALRYNVKMSALMIFVAPLIIG